MTEREPGRPRETRVDVAALAAARELICEVGYTDTTIDGISRRAGVSRAALYRRWPSKALIVHAAVFPASDLRLHLAVTGDLAADLRTLVFGLAALFERPEVLAALPGLMADAVADARLREAFQAGLESVVRDELSAMLADAVAQGRARGDISPETLLHLVTGTMLFGIAARGLDSLDDLAAELTVILQRACLL